MSSIPLIVTDYKNISHRHYTYNEANRITGVTNTTSSGTQSFNYTQRFWVVVAQFIGLIWPHAWGN